MRGRSSFRCDDSGIIPAIALILITLFGGLILTGVLMTVFRGIAVLLAIIAMIVLFIVLYLITKAGGKSKGMWAFAIVAIITLPVMIFVFLGPGAVLSLNTDTKGYTNCGYRGYGAIGAKEVLGQTAYITSWSPTGESQLLTATGAIVPTSDFRYIPSAVRYIWYITDGIVDTQVRYADYDIPRTGDNVAIQLATDQWKIQGPLPIRGIHVVVQILCSGNSWHASSEDWAYLYPGIGSIYADDQAEVGQTIRVSWDVPYVTEGTSGTGWTILGDSLASGQRVIEKAVTDPKGSLDYKVASSDFKAQPGTRNELVWTLRNDLWDKDWSTTTTIDFLGAGPTVSNLEIEGTLVAGSIVTITWNVTVNPQSLSPIDYMIIKHGCGGIEDEEKKSGAVTSYDISLENACPSYRAEVIAYDKSGRPSATSEAEFSVGEKDPGKRLDIGIAWIFWIGLILAVIIGVVLALVLPGKSKLLKIIYFLIPLLVFTGLVWLGVILV